MTDHGVVPTDRIRNVVVLGHTGTGKSTLVEAMLATARGVPRRANGDARATVDSDPEEKERGHSLSLSPVTFVHDDHRITLLDTPGGAEALGDAYPALAVADAALFVVDASSGLQPQHDQLWRECEDRGIPRMVFLNKLDQERATYQSCIDEMRDRYGKPLAPIHMPLGIHEEFDGVIDLLHEVAVEVHDGQRVVEPIPEQRVEQATQNRELLVEAVVENDDELLERYLEGQLPTSTELAEIFARGIAECGFYPVLCGSAELNIGVALLLDFIVEECPSPADHLAYPAGDGETVALVFKTASDQYVGRVNLMKVLRGTLRADDVLTVARTGNDQRLHQLFRLNGTEQQAVSAVAPGDIVAVAKLDDVVTGDQLTADGVLDVEMPEPPEGFHRVVLRPVSTSDDDKLSTALQRMVEEDPSIRSVRHLDAGALITSFLGPTHAAVTIDRLARKLGVHVTAEPAPVAFRETIRRPSSGIGKHVKQSGGHGQFGVAHIEVRPLPRGGGFEFENAIVGGVIPSTFIPSVERGIRTAMANGPLGGYPIVDIAVRLHDGKHHSVDSSDQAFQMAGILALRDALTGTDMVLLEPIDDVDISVPEDLTGAVMSDLSSRRGRILGTDVVGAGTTLIHAQVPEVELATFAAEFRSLTSGRGEVALRYDHHDEVPSALVGRLLQRAGATAG